MQPESSGAPVGRPTKYKKEYCKKAGQLALLGATNEEIADFLDVSPDTIYEWKKTKKEFSETLDRSRILADARVSNALYKRALGFRYKEEMVETSTAKPSKGEQEKDEQKSELIQKKRVTKKYALPDVGAMSLWLKNRQPTKYREGRPLSFDDLSEEVLDKLIAMVLSREANANKT